MESSVGQPSPRRMTRSPSPVIHSVGCGPFHTRNGARPRKVTVAITPPAAGGSRCAVMYPIPFWDLPHVATLKRGTGAVPGGRAFVSESQIMMPNRRTIASERSKSRPQERRLVATFPMVSVSARQVAGAAPARRAHVRRSTTPSSRTHPTPLSELAARVQSIDASPVAGTPAPPRDDGPWSLVQQLSELREHPTLARSPWGAAFDRVHG